MLMSLQPDKKELFIVHVKYSRAKGVNWEAAKIDVRVKKNCYSFLGKENCAHSREKLE